MKVVLPTDNTTQYNSTYPMELLWDGNPGTIYYTGKKSGVPTWFTFDVGQVVKLRRVRYNQRTSPASVLWSNNNPRYRSEEHTSELQSLMRISYAVFCLKKQIYH